MTVSNAHCLSNRDAENVAAQVVGVWRERDVFAVCCPLGLGKLCFAYLLSDCDKIHLKSATSIVVVVVARYIAGDAARCGSFSSNTRTCKLP